MLGINIRTTQNEGSLGILGQVVTVNDDNTLTIENNQGNSFTIDTTPDSYDGTYSVTQAELDAGPVALVATALSGDVDPEAGETLSIVPPLFAYDPDLGDVGDVTYTANGTNAVDVTDPANPTLLIDAADAGVTLTVTASLTQTGVGTTNSVSNGVTIEDLPAPSITVTRLFADALADDGGFDTEGEWNGVDLSAHASGDLILAFVGPTDNFTAMTFDDGTGAVAMNLEATTTGNNGSRCQLFSHTLTSAGTALNDFLATPGVNAINRYMELFIVRGGVIADVQQAADSGGTINPLSVDVSITDTINEIVAFVCGFDWDTETLTGVTANAKTATTNVDIITGRASNVAGPTHTVSFDQSPTQRKGAIIVNLE